MMASSVESVGGASADTLESVRMPDFTVHGILAEGERASNWIDDGMTGKTEWWSIGVVEWWMDGNGTAE